jgi:transcriptional regulator with XRE-family HTH domain
MVVAPDEVFRRRMQQVREQHPMSRRQLSARLAEIGFAMDWTTITKIEQGRKKTVPLEYVFAIAYALDVSPAFLLLPDAKEQVAVAPNVEPEDSVRLELWLRGDEPLPGQDRRRFLRELPPNRLTQLHKAALELEYGRPSPTEGPKLRDEDDRDT